jgi:hypothetical protein
METAHDGGLGAANLALTGVRNRYAADPRHRREEVSMGM